MENVADALKMAAAVLIFVLAISIIIFSFSEARRTADTIFEYKDRETTYEYYTIPEGGGGLSRTVSLETIIPSIFRAYLENYKIVFEGLNKPIYKIKNAEGNWVNKYSLDLETNLMVVGANGKAGEYRNAVLGTDEQKKEFIGGILYHNIKTIMEFLMIIKKSLKINLV